MQKSYFSSKLYIIVNPLSANLTKWSNTLKQFVSNLPTNCLNVYDHFVGLALKGVSIVNTNLKKNQILGNNCNYNYNQITILQISNRKLCSFFKYCKSNKVIS